MDGLEGTLRMSIEKKKYSFSIYYTGVEIGWERAKHVD